MRPSYWAAGMNRLKSANKTLETTHSTPGGGSIIYANAAKGTESLSLRESATDMLSPEYNAYIAHNKGAACDLGRGTEWCTAAPGADWHKGYYSPEDPIFIIEEKNNNRKKNIFLSQIMTGSQC